MGFVAIDCESCGKDFYHGSRPFVLTTCTDRGVQWWCEWDVDPLTRKVQVSDRDVHKIREIIATHDTLVFHNSKFDVRALATIGVVVPWGKVEDTLVASHVLNSSAGHRLDEVCEQYLKDEYGKPLKIGTYEKALEDAVKTARRRVSAARGKDKRGTGNDRDSIIARWQIAQEGMPDLPSATGGGKDGEGKLWRNDYWLPSAFVRRFPDDPEFATWKTVLRDYANVDTSITALLWPVLRDMLTKRGYYKVYKAKLAATPAAYRMEQRGVTINLPVMRALQTEYTEEAEELSAVCVGIARSMGYDLVLPKSTTNYSLDDFVFGRAPKICEYDEKGNLVKKVRNSKAQRTHAPDTLNLTPLRETESGNPSFDYDARELYLAELDPASKAYAFVESFGRRCELDTGLSYLAGYERFVLPMEENNVSESVNCVSDRIRNRSVRGVQETITEKKFVVLHPNMNTTGTATTRWSHSNPNSANVSERSVVNARSCFCPAEGRVWYSMDAAGIELVIPAKVAGEEAVLDVITNPDKPPYYGSYHLLVFDILRPELFAKYGKDVKTECKREYTDTKSFNFCKQYGGQERKSDATARVKGASRMVGSRLPRIEALAKQTIARARDTGGVETVPDRSVDHEHGYPITCRRSPYGSISPTVPFAYFVSGTAGWWLNRAVVKCDAILERWREEEGYDAYMILSVHDELVFDHPLNQTVRRVISGGQTGADQAGLRAAKASGRQTGGFINHGFKTLDGPNPSLAEYGLVELDSPYYATRTAKNVEESECTLRFATDFNSAGEKCTLNAINKFNRAYMNINPNSPVPVANVLAWLTKEQISVVNVAGNSEQTSPGIGEFVEKYMKQLLAADDGNLPRVRELRLAMESCGDDMDIPITVTVERHTESWAVGESIS